MKKSISIFSIVLISGLGNLFAQQDTKAQDTKVTETQSKEAKMKESGMQEENLNTPSQATVDNSSNTNSMGNKKAMNNNTAMDKDRKMGNPNSDNPANSGNMATMDNIAMDKKMGMMPDVSSWPKASRMAVEEITAKYGKPDAITEEELGWKNKGVWKKICISKKETKHSFPIEHTDMMQQTIGYNVPEDKMDDLGKFDGSVTFDRTQGTMSARCDVEANNLLALNLAHDIITGKKTTEQARTAFAEIVKQKMKGGNPEYMQKLTFSPQENAADPDKNTTGLTKEDVMKGMQKAEK